MVLFLYVLWKAISRDWRLYVPLLEMDLKTGLRKLEQHEIDATPPKTLKSLPMRIVHGLF